MQVDATNSINIYQKVKSRLLENKDAIMEKARLTTQNSVVNHTSSNAKVQNKEPYVVLDHKALQLLQEDDAGLVPDLDSIKEVIHQKRMQQSKEYNPHNADQTKLHQEALDLQAHLRKLSVDNGNEVVRFKNSDTGNTISIVIGEVSERAANLTYDERIIQGYVGGYKEGGRASTYNDIHKMRFYNQYEFEKSGIDRAIQSHFEAIHKNLEVLDSVKAERAIQDRENSNNRPFSGAVINIKEKYLVHSLERLDSRLTRGTFDTDYVWDQFAQLSKEYGRVVDIDELFTKYNI